MLKALSVEKVSNKLVNVSLLLWKTCCIVKSLCENPLLININLLFILCPVVVM